MNWPFKQRVVWSWKGVFYMQSAFPLIETGEYVEPTETWRRLRAGLRLISVVVALVAVLRPLEGTVRALFVMLLELAGVTLFYVLASYYIMNYAPYEPARKEVLPETIQAQRELDYIQEQALQGDENFVEDSGHADYRQPQDGALSAEALQSELERQNQDAEARYQEALAASRALQEELQQSLERPAKKPGEGRLDRDTKELPPLS